MTAPKLRRWCNRIGTAVAVLVTLVAGQAILRTEPDYHETVAPFYLAGEPGKPVTVSGLNVTMLGVRGAAKAGLAGGPYVDTGGVWVLVRVRLEATTKTTTTRYLALADDQHRTFRATQRFRQPLGELSWDLQPGIPIEGEIAFEVPRAVATSLTLRVAETFNELTNGELNALTDIRVPVTEGDVSRWLASQTPAILADPTVVT
jgi:hypothetical protein